MPPNGYSLVLGPVAALGTSDGRQWKHRGRGRAGQPVWSFQFDTG